MYCYMRRRGKVIDGAGHDATLNHTSLPRATGYRMGMRGDMQPSSSPPILTGTRRTQQRLVGRSVGRTAHIGQGSVGLLAGAPYDTTLQYSAYYHHHLR